MTGAISIVTEKAPNVSSAQQKAPEEFFRGFCLSSSRGSGSLRASYQKFVKFSVVVMPVFTTALFVWVVCPDWLTATV
jgi:hypothetical protein